MLEKPLFEVMLSSTFRDLIDQRTYVSDVLKKHRLHAIEMEDDASLSDQDMIDASLAKVDAANAYVCIIGKRYGQIRQCNIRNPHDLSLTELEFERAVGRGIPIAVLVMGADYPVPDKGNEFDPPKREKLQGFRDRVGLPHRVTADFDSREQFLTCVPTAIAELRSALEKRAASATLAAATTNFPAPRVDDVLPPAPPTFHIVKPFTQGHAFVGRKKELERITRWATGANPLLVFEAIGGMGKSMVTYRWMDQISPTVRTDWAGRIWYSFYEEGASMNDFCVHALAYIERRPPRDFLGRRTPDLEQILLSRLHEKPWLIVMDGLERVLVAYHRFDKAQLRDDEAIADPNKAGRDPYRCIQPADDHLLQALTTARPSKLLVSTRNMPTMLLNASADPIMGVEHERLTGLEPEDAEAMMREAGARGDSWRIQSYLETHFECHPLMVGVVAGMVNTYVAAPGAFDRWIADPEGAGAVDLTTLEGLVQKRDHILKVAYEALEPDARKLLSVLAFFSQSVAGEVLVELNPRRPERPKEVRKPSPVDEDGDYDLRDLRRRRDREMPSAAKAAIEGRIAARRAELKAIFALHTDAHRQYEAAQAQWRASPELRTANAWLGKAAIDLQRRGLVITDRITARYDLHPMVRGFVRHALSGDESAITGRAVADYARSRSKAKYESAASLTDLVPDIEIVTALTLGGHYEDAVAAINIELQGALFQLELFAEALALLEPFFSQGWNNLPERVPDPDKSGLSGLAALCFRRLGDHKRAELLFRFAIARGIVDESLYGTAHWIRDYAMLFDDIGSLYHRSRLLRLHETISLFTSDKDQMAQQNISQAWLEFKRGSLTSARKKLDALKDAIAAGKIEDEYERSNIIGLEIELLEREKCLTDLHLKDALAQARSWRDRARERELLHFCGNFLQSKGEHHRAMEAFERSIAMARGVHIPANESEARYAISLVAVDQPVEAFEIAKRISAVDDPPHVQLAELYLALDDKLKAHEHALAGYRRAWGDGPPYALHWDLEDCRKVLIALGEPEPQLALFDPARVQPFDFEPDLHRLIEKKKAEIEEEKRNDAKGK
jgi:tetratricopeptide (TPR) repeat protein